MRKIISPMVIADMPNTMSINRVNWNISPLSGIFQCLTYSRKEVSLSLVLACRSSLDFALATNVSKRENAHAKFGMLAERLDLAERDDNFQLS